MPVLYSQSAYQSPVFAEPGELLFLPGYGFSPDNLVVYRAIGDTAQALPAPPDSVPAAVSTLTGIAPVVSAANAPYSLTVRLPDSMQSGRSYALWVRTSDGHWSNGIRINDARPLWISPSSVYVSSSIGSLPRYLKVIGRNLQAAPGSITRVRLNSGYHTYTFEAADDGDSTTSIERYVARVALPDYIHAGSYTVALSRDSESWITVEGQTLTVAEDPAPLPDFGVEAYGGCVANDEQDDTPCVKSAIDAAKSAGGGTVVFGPGVWNLTQIAATEQHGILLPIGVSLRGSGAAVTTLVRGVNWGPAGQARPTFTLQGRNHVQGFTFRDARVYTPADVAAGGSMLQLGKRFDLAASGDPRLIADIVITQNVFDRPFIAVISGGLPIARLFVTHNVFGAYYVGFFPGGSRFNVADRFTIDDSVISHNTFKPGSYIDVAIRQGTIASQVGASHRLDFSDNIADGTSTEYLNDPVNDARGWRSGFFWHMSGNHEMTLISRNKLTCTGDKAGDGESIVYDNNANTFAFETARTVVDATASTATVEGALVATQNGRSVPSDYYIGHWMQITYGPGVGQLRKIVSYVTDPATSRVTFTVAPAWDVPPESSISRVTVGRQFWQTYIVDNFVDHRTVGDGAPGCLKSNRTRPKGGVLALAAQTSDSAVEGNRMYDTDGINLNHSYVVAPDGAGTRFLTFVEVRGNTIDHEYALSSDCSWSGISLWYGASQTADFPPPVTAGYGISIVRNTVVEADGLHGGAISVSSGWHAGPPPHEWEYMNNTLIHRNVIRDLSAGPPPPSCEPPQTTRIGIRLFDAMVWNTVLYANTCINVATKLRDAGTATQRVCPSPVSDSCECSD